MIIFVDKLFNRFTCIIPTRKANIPAIIILASVGSSDMKFAVDELNSSEGYNFPSSLSIELETIRETTPYVPTNVKILIQPIAIIIIWLSFLTYGQMSTSPEKEVKNSGEE